MPLQIIRNDITKLKCDTLGRRTERFGIERKRTVNYHTNCGEVYKF